MAQLEAYLEMDSTDEKMFKKMQLIREAEAKEIAKKQQKEISRRRIEMQGQPQSAQGTVKAISSQDYQSSLGLGPAQIGNHSSGSGAQITMKTSTPSGNWMDEGASAT